MTETTPEQTTGEFMPALASQQVADLLIAGELAVALKTLLHEVIEAGFDTAKDYNWPDAIRDARQALDHACVSHD